MVQLSLHGTVLVGEMGTAAAWLGQVNGNEMTHSQRVTNGNDLRVAIVTADMVSPYNIPTVSFLVVSIAVSCRRQRTG